MPTAGSTMGPDQKNDYPFTAVGYKPMFFYPSISQAQREFSFSETDRSCTGFNAYGNCIGFEDKYYYTSNYWAFYRSGVRYINGTLSCGWITVEFGCNWTYKEKEKFLGIGIGSDSGSGGTWPYSNETLNLTPTTVIVGNGGDYD